MTRTIAWMLGVLLCTAACSGDDETPAGRYGEPCDANTRCEEGLQCLQQMCTMACTESNVDSTCRKLSPQYGICQFGACFNACSATSVSACAGFQTCRQAGSEQGTCRPN